MLKKRVKLIIVFIILFILQFDFFPYFSFRNTVPDLLSILVVFYALYVKKHRLLLFALCIGLCKDIFSSNYFGVNIISLWVAAHALFFLSRKFPQDLLVIQVGLVGIYVLLVQSIILIIMFLFDMTFSAWQCFVPETVPSVFYTMICAFFVVPALKAIMKDSLRQYNLF
ncbi:MAG: rod shape-determining protein MreD [Candidatus Omnitrophica bacterium]|nr:rod shape-determining protein MreD [Candidatus Omnitrophota bacterium]